MTYLICDVTNHNREFSQQNVQAIQEQRKSSQSGAWLGRWGSGKGHYCRGTFPANVEPNWVTHHVPAKPFSVGESREICGTSSGGQCFVLVSLTGAFDEHEFVHISPTSSEYFRLFQACNNNKDILSNWDGWHSCHFPGFVEELHLARDQRWAYLDRCQT